MSERWKIGVDFAAIGDSSRSAFYPIDAPVPVPMPEEKTFTYDFSTMDLAGSTDAIEKIAQSYLEWKGLPLKCAITRGNGPTSLHVVLSVWSDVAPKETTASTTIDRRELAKLRGPEDVVRFLYMRLDKCVEVVQNILDAISREKRGRYDDFALDFVSGSLSGFPVPASVMRPGPPSDALPKAAPPKPEPKPPGWSEMTRPLELD